MQYLDSEGCPYMDLNEFVRIAMENQLTLDRQLPAEPAPTPSTEAESDQTSGLTKSEAAQPEPPTPFEEWWRRTDASEVEVVPVSSQDDAPALASLTNRMAPFLIGTRVLAAAASAEGSVDPQRFIDRASSVARHLSSRLRDQDRSAGRKGIQKWSTGWPGGNDPKKSLDRFRRYFLIERSGANLVGPLLDLGLCAVVDGRLLPSERCLVIAAEPSGVFGESATLMSEIQMQRFTDSVLSIDAEKAEIAFLLRAIKASGQSDVQMLDESIASGHESWSPAQVTSHRAAICGRLVQLELIDSHEVGGRSIFKLTERGVEVLEQLKGAAA